MGTLHNHQPVKLFTALTYKAGFDLTALIRQLEDKFNAVEAASEPYDFSAFTDYYQNEMGSRLKKHFIVFASLIDPSHLPAIKVRTNSIENNYLTKNKRCVNIDPGYITQAKLVLATTKNYSHRIYLGQGIYGDVHLHYQKGEYRPNPWTYPDYMDARNIKFFNRIREAYLKQLAAPPTLL